MPTSDAQYIGEIMLFAGTYPPRGWAFCHGQLLSIAQYDALFALIGTYYGGDGRTNFALPDLRGRVPIQQGQGPGLQYYPLGVRGGQEFVTLRQSEIPEHFHSITSSGSGGGSGGSSTANLAVYNGVADTNDAASAKSIASEVKIGFESHNLLSTNAPTGQITGAVTGITGSSGTLPSQTNNAGGNQSHENRMPFLAINYCIALEGTFPPRS